jgi:hypothetical protein
MGEDARGSASARTPTKLLLGGERGPRQGSPPLRHDPRFQEVGQARHALQVLLSLVQSLWRGLLWAVEEAQEEGDLQQRQGCQRGGQRHQRRLAPRRAPLLHGLRQGAGRG